MQRCESFSLKLQIDKIDWNLIRTHIYVCVCLVDLAIVRTDHPKVILAAVYINCCQYLIMRYSLQVAREWKKRKILTTLKQKPWSSMYVPNNIYLFTYVHIQCTIHIMDRMTFRIKKMRAYIYVASTSTILEYYSHVRTWHDTLKLNEDFLAMVFVYIYNCIPLICNGQY